MVVHVHGDFETYGTVNLPKTGAFIYAKDKHTGVWCFCYALDDGEVQTWTPGMDFPDDLREALEDPETLFFGHNVVFEILIWNHVMVPQYGWPPLNYKRCRCTMAMAYAMSLPGSLGQAAPAAGLDVAKDDHGYRVMMQLCRPRRVEADGTIVWWDDPDKMAKLLAYCVQDVVVERELARRLKPLSKGEQRLWQLDFEINMRGVYIDRDLIKCAQKIVKRATRDLNRTVQKATRAKVDGVNKVEKMTHWVNEQGVECESLDKAAITVLLAQELPANVRTVLLARREGAKASTAKMTTMELYAGDDDRMRGLLQYHGASTGRWAGRGPQPQNFYRPEFKPAQIDMIVNALLNGATAEEIDAFWGPPMSVVASCLRAMICAAPGNTLLCADFSAIEARVLAWLAGQEDVLNVFASGEDVYVYDAAKIGSDNRQLGKVCRLGLGYGMGGEKLKDTAETQYGVPLELEEAEKVKTGWRDANDKIVQFWYDCEDAAIRAAGSKKGKIARVGHVEFQRVSKSFLTIKLPSSRRLWYPYPRVEEQDTPWGVPRDVLVYKGVNSFTRKWEEISTYSGKIVENIVQAVARDLMAAAMIRADAAGIPLILTVHDELLAEVPEGAADVKAFEELLSVVPSWAAGCPLSAEGWAGKRYRK